MVHSAFPTCYSCQLGAARESFSCEAAAMGMDGETWCFRALWTPISWNKQGPCSGVVRDVVQRRLEGFRLLLAHHGWNHLFIF